MQLSKLLKKINSGDFDKAFSKLYQNTDEARKRYIKAINSFSALYGDNDVELFSVPGRSEISGNHTDHNHGKVIAAAIDLDIIAVVAKKPEPSIRITSEGYREDYVNINVLDSAKYKKGSSTALAAGMCAFFKENGYNIGGFDAFTTSQVLSGSGLSSSAAFEVMVGNILNYLYNDGKVSAVSIAKIAQKSENVFFGKPCGLMDQTACAVGGFVAIDFKDPAKPVVEKIDKSLSDYGYSLCITDTGGNHADLTEDYASVPAEMKSVAAVFGAKTLRDVDESEFYKTIPSLREKCGDRAVLRAIHFFNENKRVTKQTAALSSGDIDTFLKLASESGDSCFKYLQNVYTNKNVTEQGLSLALALSSDYRSRVHGGGFAGTIQAFVPFDETEKYRNIIDEVFGSGRCKVLSVRNYGAIKIDENMIFSPPTEKDGKGTAIC